jgi:AcrR family transcriptional regulator
MERWAANLAPVSVARPYHHGDLRRTLLDEAVALIEDEGLAGLSLRELARRAGVSHAAPAHHFGDRTGLLTALAAEGFELLGARLARVWAATGDFLEVGAAYLDFAVTHRAQFEVMYRPELHHRDDPALVAARAASGRNLYGPVSALPEREALEAAVAGWSLMHGLAQLWIDGNLPPGLGDDPAEVARAVGRHLFGGRRDRRITRRPSGGEREGRARQTARGDESGA